MSEHNFQKKLQDRKACIFFNMNMYYLEGFLPLGLWVYMFYILFIRLFIVLKIFPPVGLWGDGF